MAKHITLEFLTEVLRPFLAPGVEIKLTEETARHVETITLKKGMRSVSIGADADGKPCFSLRTAVGTPGDESIYRRTS